MDINAKTLSFIRQHAGDDVRKLALQGARDADVDLKCALQQIEGRQTSRQKLPTWAASDGIVYPPHLNMEQCSSEVTARYKAEVAGCGGTFVDLTGGFGIDCWALSAGFVKAVYVERDTLLCDMARHNFSTMGCHASVCCASAEDYVAAMEHTDLVFIDPARRNGQGGRTYGIADCTPDVLQLMPVLTEKADRVLLKLSPMLEWRKAVSDLRQAMAAAANPYDACHVHIVSVANECKELLVLLGRGMSTGKPLTTNNRGGGMSTGEPLTTDYSGRGGLLQVTCSNLYGGCCDRFEWVPDKQGDVNTQSAPYPSLLLTCTYLYEPNASIMKAGCYSAMEASFPVHQIAPNSHLFLSDQRIEHFPGRSFEIRLVASVNELIAHQKERKKTAQGLPLVEAANITVRNFPLTADQLRRKLKLKDGGNTYIFATTLPDGSRRLFVCRKL